MQRFLCRASSPPQGDIKIIPISSPGLPFIPCPPTCLIEDTRLHSQVDQKDWKCRLCGVSLCLPGACKDRVGGIRSLPPWLTPPFLPGQPQETCRAMCRQVRYFAPEKTSAPYYKDVAHGPPHCLLPACMTGLGLLHHLTSPVALGARPAIQGEGQPGPELAGRERPSTAIIAASFHVPHLKLLPFPKRSQNRSTIQD